MSGILPYPDVRLRTKSVEVDHDDPLIPALISGLNQVMKQSGGIAVAAPQIGAHLRVVVYKPDVMQDINNQPVAYMINPKITSTRDAPVLGKEGCLSFRDLFISVARVPEVDVEWEDMSGNKFSGTFRDLPARCVQHEIDHLDGILMIDRMPKVLRGPALSKYQKLRGHK
jgi:peptide deformylase